MEYNLLMEMHQRIDTYIAEGKLDKKFIVIFGSNEPAERIMEYLGAKGIRVDGLIDNNRKKDGTMLNGVMVTLPDRLLLPKKENVVVLIASKYYPEMVVQLNGMGYEEETEILKVVEYSAFSTPALTEEEFEKRVAMIKRGEQVYQKLLAKMPSVQKIFVCPLSVLGDTYVGMTGMRQYMQQNRITKYVLVLINKACAKIACLFGFEQNVFRVSSQEMSDFLQFAVFTDMAEGRILVLNHRQPYTCRIGEIGNYKNINFMDHFRYGIFELPEGSKPEVPSATRNNAKSQEYVTQLFLENGLEKEKTVILFPYAKTAAKIDDDFWIQLTKKLQNLGYTVCTNSGGDGELAIPGTKELFFDIRYALETVEAAGTVVGLRSGLCDVISTAKAKKIILYPDRFYGPDSFLNFFSLNRMELCSDAVELVWKNDIKVMIERILQEMEKNV